MHEQDRLLQDEQACCRGSRIGCMISRISYRTSRLAAVIILGRRRNRISCRTNRIGCRLRRIGSRMSRTGCRMSRIGCMMSMIGCRRIRIGTGRAG